MKLNEKIIYCRKKAGLSQLDLADLLGVSRQSVSKWETGESNPEITKIPRRNRRKRPAPGIRNPLPARPIPTGWITFPGTSAV